VASRFWESDSEVLGEKRKERKTISAPPQREKMVVLFLGVYLALQILIPFRHFLYPGSVHWREEVHRFSWHMMLRSKESRAVFTVRHEGLGEVETVKPLEYLTGRQYLKMIDRPDMILQFCHHLADLFDDGVAVFAEVRCSLTSRPVQLLVDPECESCQRAAKFATGEVDY
jgi:vitamin K-dependent gamma-carboxylase